MRDLDVAGEVVVQGLIQTFRCASPDCNQLLAQGHAMSMAVFRVLRCPACGKGSQFENGPGGWTVRMLKQETPIATPSRGRAKG